MPKSKFHHYVQRAHLSLFADASKALHVRGKDGGSFPTSPDAIFAENNLYCYESEAGVSSEFEDAMTELENLTFPALAKIAETRAMDAAKRTDVNTYLAASYLRNPTFRKMVIEKHELIAKDMAAIVDAKGELPSFPNVGKPDMDGKSLTELIKAGKVKTKINNVVFLHAVLEQLDHSAGNIAQFTLSLVISPNGEFVVGDHPVTMMHPGVDVSDGFSFLGPSGNCELTYPISKHVCIVGRRGDAFPQSEASTAVEQLNKRQAVYARRHIAAETDNDAIKTMAERYAGVAFTCDVQKIAEAQGIVVRSRQGLFPLAEWNKVKNDFVPLTGLL